MIREFYKALQESSPVATIIISVAIMLFFGFLMTRVTKKLRLPNVTAYIVTGILIGPYVLDLIPSSVVSGMDFMADIALAFIAFSTGQYFRFSSLKKNGAKVIVITLCEAFLASGIVFVLLFVILRLDLVFSLVLAALAAATSSASTVMTIRQTRAKGDFVDTLLQLIAVDNIVALLMYSTAISVAAATISGEPFSVSSVVMPLVTNIGVLLLGGVFGWFMKLMIEDRSADNRLIIAVAFLFAFCGICALLEISPLLGCMSMGTVYVNIAKDDNLFKQLNYFSPPILLLYFVRSGLNFNLSALFGVSTATGAVPLFLITILYFFGRIAGKYFGSFFGCLFMKKKKEVRNYLGMALVPQAGVAIGLAALGARTLGGEVGSALQTIILSACILYELIGPASAKLSLYLSKSYSNVLEEIVEVEATTETGEAKSSLDMLIERIQKIQEEIPQHTVNEEELAFTQAAEEQYEPVIVPRQRFKNRR
jgi:Kef-type K+ transport system membrane component KefB